MQTRNVLLLPFIVALAAACADPSLPEPVTQAARLREEAAAERQRIAGLHLVKSAAVSSLAPADDMAAALDIPGGLIANAQLTSPGAEATLVAPTFGVIRPRKGNSLVVMSTGRINASHLPEPGTDYSPGGIDGDVVTLRITVNVPRGANRLSFDYNFLSAESPDYVGSAFNDTFTARVTDAQGTREAAMASVNSSFFFDVSATRAGGTGFDLLFADDPAGTDSFPGNYPTGIQLFPDAGITDFKTVNIRVAGGGPVTLEFDIRDLGDGILDSTVVIDNITFSTVQVVDPNPELIDQAAGTVVTDATRLAVDGKSVQGVAADGATQLLLRVEAPGAGTVQFRVLGPNAPANGGVGAVGTLTRGEVLTVDAEEVAPGQYYAFALYQSPEGFDSGGFAQARTRPVRIALQYSPPIGTGYQDEYEITLVRPPVVVVHDIWSSCLYWRASVGISTGGLFDVTCADYSATSSDSFDSETNRRVVPGAVNEAREKLRVKGIAVTQVDVIGHGMGGLMARKFADWPSYRTFSNFNEGDINKLITVNTPHIGTRLADAVVAMRDHLMETSLELNWPKVRNALVGQNIIIDEEVDGISVEDLTTDSEAINSIGETRVPSHVMISRGWRSMARTPASASLLDHIRVLYSQVENYHPLSNGKPTSEKLRLILGPTSKLFCDDEHDLFASEADQSGGVPVGAISYFNRSIDNPGSSKEHFQAISDQLHHDRLVALLNSPANGGAFAPFIPSPRDLPRPNSCDGGSLTASSPGGGGRALTRAARSAGAGQTVSALAAQRVTRPPFQPREQHPGALQSGASLQGSLSIVSPTAGTPVAPGRSVTLVVEASAGFQPSVVFVSGAGKAVFFEAPPFEAQFEVPAEAIGSVKLIAFAIDEQGEMLESSPVVLPVVSPARLTSIEMLNGDATLPGPGWTRRLVALGHYDDGVMRDISSPGVGTLYSSSNLDIAEVDSNGLITGTGTGIATITVRNGTTFTSINVTIGDDRFKECIRVRLDDYNLFVLEDYSQGNEVQGRLAAGGNISLQNFWVGAQLPATETSNVMVAGGDMELVNGNIWGDLWHGGQLSSNAVTFVRGAAAQGTPIDFTARGNALRTLSSSLAALPANGSTTVESWGGVMLSGTSPRVNVFNVDGSAFTGAVLLVIDAPADSLAVINVLGPSASFINFGHIFSGGIDEHGVLFNFPQATSITSAFYGFYGTVLAPKADVTFSDGSWVGGMYARSLTGNAVGHLSRLRNTDICR